MNTHARSYLDQLREHAEEQRRIHDLEREAEAQANLVASIQAIKRTKPLEQQITELMATLPPQVRNRPWSMAELVKQLSGKYRDRPHAQNVGEALRRLGWRRVRLWRDGADGQRVWIPIL